MLDAALNLAAVLGSKPHLDEDEMATYRSLLALVETQMRLAVAVLVRDNANADEGCSDDSPRFTPTER